MVHPVQRSSCVTWLTKPATKGVVLGAANALTIGVLAAIWVATNGESRSAPFSAKAPVEILKCTAIWACPLGAVAGLFVGAVVDDLGELRGLTGVAGESLARLSLHDHVVVGG